MEKDFFSLFRPQFSPKRRIRVSPKADQHIFPSHVMKLLNFKIVHSVVLSLLQFSYTKNHFLSPKTQNHHQKLSSPKLSIMIFLSFSLIFKQLIIEAQTANKMEKHNYLISFFLGPKVTLKKLLEFHQKLIDAFSPPKV